ncbi:hypothetical protein [Paenibacillus antarcticus]|nr:hypothetical protein [Paenibacillus antarcticus]
MGIRIKASGDFIDLLALNMVGGQVTEGKHPRFAFRSDIQRNRYNEIRKRLKGGESLESIARSDTKA